MATIAYRPGTSTALLAGVVLLLVLWAGPADAATTFTVNTTGDAGDTKIDGVCDASPERGRQCTLRAAIREANNAPGADTIAFNIASTAAVKTVSPTRPLPAITEAVTVDGYTQGSRTAATSDDARPNDAIFNFGTSNAVIKVSLNGTNAGPEADGLRVRAPGSTIKGLAINRFARSGVLVEGPGASSNKVEGNFVGTNASGTRDRGNAGDGVRVDGAPGNTVGGTELAQLNVISGNGGDGVEIVGPTATGNTVQLNLVGNAARAGSGALGNSGHGVRIEGASDNLVGNTAANFSLANYIADNGGDGVSVASGTGNRVLANTILGNAGLGIDLGDDGVSANDEGDPDTGANDLQNFPVISAAVNTDVGGVDYSGTLNSTPNQTFIVQFFGVDQLDPSGHGEGEVFLGQLSVTTDDQGDASFGARGPQSSEYAAATATNTATGDTSEFSERVFITTD